MAAASAAEIVAIEREDTQWSCCNSSCTLLFLLMMRDASQQRAEAPEAEFVV